MLLRNRSADVSTTRPYPPYVAMVLILIGTFSIGCRHPVTTAPDRGLLSENYCWWAVMRSTLPPDTVAVRFQRAYTALGLTDVVTKSSGDTAWARAGPTLLNDRQHLGGRRYASRVVAYWHGDSTHFRYYVAIDAQPADSVERGPALLGLCGDVARAAALGWSAPRSPTGEEKLEIWKRVP